MAPNRQRPGFIASSFTPPRSRVVSLPGGRHSPSIGASPSGTRPRGSSLPGGVLSRVVSPPVTSPRETARETRVVDFVETDTEQSSSTGMSPPGVVSPPGLIVPDTPNPSRTPSLPSAVRESAAPPLVHMESQSVRSESVRSEGSHSVGAGLSTSHSDPELSQHRRDSRKSKDDRRATLTEQKLSNSARAVTYCDVLCLRMTDLLDILERDIATYALAGAQTRAG